jgi:hypothetical protein
MSNTYIELDPSKIDAAAQAIARTKLQQDSPSATSGWIDAEWDLYWESVLTDSVRKEYREQAMAALVFYLGAPPAGDVVEVPSQVLSGTVMASNMERLAVKRWAEKYADANGYTTFNLSTGPQVSVEFIR